MKGVKGVLISVYFAVLFGLLLAALIKAGMTALCL